MRTNGWSGKAFGTARIVTFLAAALFVLGGMEAGAGKPQPPPPVDTGTIYYGSGGYVWSMDPDGSNKTNLYLTGGWPSLALHDVKRWFLRKLPIAGETYPSGSARNELFAVTEEGDEVQITDAFDVEVSGVNHRWATDDVADGKISYLGIRWATDDAGEWIQDESGDYVIAEAGLFTLALDWTAILAGTWSAGEPACTEIDLTLSEDESGIYFPANTKYDWSPDGAKVVYFDSANSTAALRVAPADGSSSPVTIVSGTCYAPRWSSSDLIVCINAGAIKTIKPAGTGLTTIVAAPTKRYLSLEDPIWSPNATHLVYCLYKSDPFNLNRTFYRVTASGEDKTQIYSAQGGGLFAWCQ